MFYITDFQSCSLLTCFLTKLSQISCQLWNQFGRINSERQLRKEACLVNFIVNTKKWRRISHFRVLHASKFGQFSIKITKWSKSPFGRCMCRHELRCHIRSDYFILVENIHRRLHFCIKKQTKDPPWKWSILSSNY